jgi:hypothetical protein
VEHNKLKVLLPAVIILVLNGASIAQGAENMFFAPPIVGGTGALSTSKDKTDFALATRTPQQHKTPTGKPCVIINGLSTPQIINPTIFEHVLIIQNVCSQPIRIRACYFQSTSCVNTVISGYTRRQQNLGIAPNAKDFRYSYTEDFN